MPIGTVLVLVLLGTSTVCGLGGIYYREVIIEELQQIAPEAIRRFPRLSTSWFSLLKLHEQYCPQSKVRAVARTLTAVSLGSIAVIALWGFVLAFSKPPVH